MVLPQTSPFFLRAHQPSASTSPLSHLFKESKSGDSSASLRQRFAHLAAMSAVWDLLSICFLHGSASASTTANTVPLMAASAAGQASSCLPLVKWVAVSVSLSQSPPLFSSCIPLAICILHCSCPHVTWIYVSDIA